MQIRASHPSTLRAQLKREAFKSYPHRVYVHWKRMKKIIPNTMREKKKIVPSCTLQCTSHLKMQPLTSEGLLNHPSAGSLRLEVYPL